MFSRIFVLSAFAALLFSPQAFALEAPKGPVILTVRGALSAANVDGTAQFDLAMLDALGGRAAMMETPWTEGRKEFSGPYLRAVLDAAGALGGSKLIVRALNDYFAEVPADDAKIDTILATRLDGKPMAVRDKGPLFLIYPFDKDKTLYNEKYFSRSVWQIKEIEVRP